MRDSHGSVIDGDTKIVNRLSITSHNHEISKSVQVPTNLHHTIKQISNLNLAKEEASSALS